MVCVLGRCKRIDWCQDIPRTPELEREDAFEEEFGEEISKWVAEAESPELESD